MIIPELILAVHATLLLPKSLIFKACNNDNQQAASLLLDEKKINDEQELLKEKVKYFTLENEKHKKWKQNDDFEAVAFDCQKNCLLQTKSQMMYTTNTAKLFFF